MTTPLTTHLSAAAAVPGIPRAASGRCPMTSVPGQGRVITQPTEAVVAITLVEAAATARWPGGTLLRDLDDTVLREHLAPAHSRHPRRHQRGHGPQHPLGHQHADPPPTGAPMLTRPRHPTFPLVSKPLTGLCECCRQQRARVVLRWPDTQFEVCLSCLPEPMMNSVVFSERSAARAQLATTDSPPARAYGWRHSFELAAGVLGLPAPAARRPGPGPTPGGPREILPR